LAIIRTDGQQGLLIPGIGGEALGDINQKLFLKKFIPKVSGPVLEIGSKDYGTTSSFREYYCDHEYVGVDMEDGKNVDCVLDLTQGIGNLPKNYFALTICCSVLEHVRKPWVMAENITTLVRSRGMLYVSVPWVWGYHQYPDDYYRFSWRGIMELFPELEWEHIYYATSVANEFFEITEADIKIDRRLGIKNWRVIGKRRRYLPCLMINMLGTKR
jgi:hypothetical protein